MATRVQQEAVVTKSVKQESRVDAVVEIPLFLTQSWPRLK